MNILVLNWYDLLNPAAGGAERYLFEIFSRLVGQGHRVTLVCQSFPGSQKIELVMGIRVVRLHTHAKGLLGKSCQTIGRSFMYYARHHREYDMIVEFVNKIPYFTPLYARQEERVALQCHFNSCTFRLEYPKIGWLFQMIERLYFRLFYTREKFIVISPGTQSDLDTYGICSDRSELIYSGIDCPSLQVSPSQKPTIVYLGRLQRYKSVDVLLKAMVGVVQQIPEAILRVMGNGRDRKRLTELVSELGIESNVVFEGYVSEQKKWEILAGAWLHANPSRKEGWGINVFEAACYRVPSVASRVPGLCDAVKDGVTGRLVEYGNVPQLAETIVELLQDHQQRIAMGDHAYKFSLGFTWDSSAQQMERYLGHLLEPQIQRVPLPFLTELRFPNPL